MSAGPSTTVYVECMTCDAKSPRESDHEGGELARKQVGLWMLANRWRTFPAVKGRRRDPVTLCAACVTEIGTTPPPVPRLEDVG